MSELANVIYCLFFGLLDFFLFSLLTQFFEVNKKSFIIVILTILLSIFLHSGLFDIKFLLPSEDFFDLLIFSFGLVVIYVIGKVQGTVFDRRFEDDSSSIYPPFKSVIDFVKNKLIYIMIYAYQFLAIWRPELR